MMTYPNTSPLAPALARFNEVFDRSLALPMTVEDVEGIAEFAELRGRHEVEQRSARQPHKLKVMGSSPIRATTFAPVFLGIAIGGWRE